MTAAGSWVTVVVAGLALGVGHAGAFAHEGHDPGARTTTATVSSPSDAAQRWPDGSVHLGKSIQRILELRTVISAEQEHDTIVELAGRVVPDPNLTARVQASRDGRIEPSAGALPHIGRHVTKDEVLATLVATLSPSEESQLRQRLVEIERELALLLPRAEHASVVNPNMPMGDAAVALLQEIQIQSQALVRQAEIVKAALAARVEIRAPIAGVVSATPIATGQMVAARDVLVEIVGGGPPRIEAFGFGSALEQISSARASLGTGASFDLAFLGRSPVLRGNAVTYLFGGSAAVPGAEAGRPVRVFVSGGEKRRGQLLPRAAVQNSGGSAIVWEHTDPERFIARPVVFASHDAEHVLVTAGVRPGARIVVQGAVFLSQVR